MLTAFDRRIQTVYNYRYKNLLHLRSAEQRARQPPDPGIAAHRRFLRDAVL